jgi:hypothetical protein
MFVRSEPSDLDRTVRKGQINFTVATVHPIANKEDPSLLERGVQLVLRIRGQEKGCDVVASMPNR